MLPLIKGHIYVTTRWFPDEDESLLLVSSMFASYSCWLAMISIGRKWVILLAIRAFTMNTFSKLLMVALLRGKRGPPSAPRLIGKRLALKCPLLLRSAKKIQICSMAEFVLNEISSAKKKLIHARQWETSYLKNNHHRPAHFAKSTLNSLASLL